MADRRATDEEPTWSAYRAALRQADPKRPSPLVEWFREYGRWLVLTLIGSVVFAIVVWYFATAKLIIVNRSPSKFCSVMVFDADSNKVMSSDTNTELDFLADIRQPIKTQSTTQRIIVVSLEPGSYAATAYCGLYRTDSILFDLEPGQTKTVIIKEE